MKPYARGLPVMERIERWIVRLPESGCWLWEGACTHDGYATLTVDGRTITAHRYVYEQMIGAIPAGLSLDHLCRVRCCVNPAHLEPVPIRENIQRGGHSLKTHCANGHLLAPPNLYPAKRGGRVCKACALDSSRKYQQRKRT